MAKVIVSVNTTPKALPAGVEFGGYRFSVSSLESEAALVSVQTVQDKFATFEDLPDGRVRFMVHAISKAGEVIGDAVQLDADLAGGAQSPTTYDAPAGISFLVA